MKSKMSSLIYKKYNIGFNPVEFHQIENITYKNRSELMSLIDALQGKYTTLLVSSEVYNNLEKELKSNSMAIYRSQNEIILKDRNIAIKKMPKYIHA